MRSAFITGASGFLGRALGERLRRDGVEVSGVDLIADPSRSVVAGDVSETGEWQGAAAGADIVVHTAAAVTNSANHERAWRMNVVATKRAAEAAANGGAKRFVHLSSVRAFSDLGFPDGVTEDHPVRPDGNTYVDTKIASEQVALQAHAAGDVKVTVIRPGDVYGPGSRPWTIMPIELLRSGRFALPAGGEGIFSPVYVDDLIEGVVLAATKRAGAGQIFTISGGVGVSCLDFFSHYTRMLGKRPPRTLPTAAAIGLVAIPEVLARLTRTPTETTRTSMRYFARTGTYSIAKARELLGYVPAVDLDEGMRRTEEWLRAEGLL
ncbi:NAD(P)-dependent oxidoreductase [soil metagenome]